MIVATIANRSGSDFKFQGGRPTFFFNCDFGLPLGRFTDLFGPPSWPWQIFHRIFRFVWHLHRSLGHEGGEDVSDGGRIRFLERHEIDVRLRLAPLRPGFHHRPALLERVTPAVGSSAASPMMWASAASGLRARNASRFRPIAEGPTEAVHRQLASPHPAH